MLSKRFIEGDTDLSLEEVTQELLATDFIFQNTLYGELSEDFFRAFAGHLVKKQHLSWTSAWEVTRFYAPTVLKLLCLDCCGNLRIPQFTPVPEE